MEGFTAALMDGDLNRAATFLDLSNIPPGARGEVGERASLSLGLVLDALQLPAWRDADSLKALAAQPLISLTDTTAGSIELVNLAHTDAVGDWRFSAASVHGALEQLRLAIPEIRAALLAGKNRVLVFDTEAPEIALAVELPAPLHTRFLGLSIAQWIGVPIVLGLSWLGARVFRICFHALLSVLGRHRAKAWREESARASNAFAWTAALWIGTWTMLGLGLPISILMVALLAMKIATILCFAWTLIEVVALIRAWVASPSGVQMDDLASRGVARIAQIVIVAGAFLAIVGSVGERESVNHAVAALGIGGIAIGLAVQDPLKNYFAGLVLAADRPFRTGDRVSIDALTGTIVHIGMRATSIRTDFNSLVSLPNATVAGAKIESEPTGGKDHEIRISMLLPLVTPIDRIAQFRDAAKNALSTMRGVRPDSIELGVRGNNEKGIDFGVLLAAAADTGKKSEVQDAVMLILLESARSAGAFVSEAR